MPIVNSANISVLVQRTLNRVDPRLVDHGLRVAYLVSRLLEVQGRYTGRDFQDLCFLAMLHDVGAYKTDEIDRMVQFESENIWEHSIYGYLFLRRLSPLGKWADGVLFHHIGAPLLNALDAPCRDVAQIINLADRVDVFLSEHGPDRPGLSAYPERSRGGRFGGEFVDLFYAADARFDLAGRLAGGEAVAFTDIVPRVSLSDGDIDTYLRMLVYTIDFRSQHTVTHTITTTRISDAVARLMGMGPEEVLHIHYGAMLHDLGKIGIPVEILEYPGRLSPQAMAVMRTHVTITGEILGGAVDSVTTQIALRHHEKLDGSGYPAGLCGAELTLSQRIVVVADIVSALLGTRSYKDAYPKEKTLSILREQTARGLIDPAVVEVIARHFDEILSEVREHCTPVLQVYRGITAEYGKLLQTCSALGTEKRSPAGPQYH